MSRYSHPSQQVTAGEPTSALDGLVGDTEVLREAERLRHHETLDDIIIVKNVTLLKKAQFGKEAVNVLNKVSFGVRPGMEVRCRHEVCQARSSVASCPSPACVCVSGERFCIFGSEFGSGRTELLEIVAGMRYPTEGFASLLSFDCSKILRGMTFGVSDQERDSIHGRPWGSRDNAHATGGTWQSSREPPLRDTYSMPGCVTASMGYCPSTNCFHGQLTVRENLRYARLKACGYRVVDNTRAMRAWLRVVQSVRVAEALARHERRCKAAAGAVWTRRCCDNGGRLATVLQQTATNGSVGHARSATCSADPRLTYTRYVRRPGWCCRRRCVVKNLLRMHMVTCMSGQAWTRIRAKSCGMRCPK